MGLCKKIFRIVLLASVTIILISGPVIAAYTYYATVQVQETNGTDYDYLPIIADIDNDHLADNGYISLTGLDTRILSGSDELEHMVTDDKVLFVPPSTDGDSTSNYKYTLGNSLQSDFPIIVGDGGYITVADADSMELGDDFDIEIDGYVDTTYVGTYPVVAAVNGGYDDDIETTVVVNLPADISSGDLLLIFFCWSEGGETTSFPAGWVELFQEESASVGVGSALGAWYKIATGTEGGTVNATITGAGGESAHTTYRITGYDDIPIVGTATVGAGDSSPDPPELKSPWGSGATLWITACGAYDRTVDAAPANYTDLRNDKGAANFQSVGTAFREYDAFGEDPRVFTISANQDWVAQTVAIQGETPQFIYKEDAFVVSITDSEEITASILEDGAASTWVSPIGFDDPDIAWFNETLAYDSNAATSAVTTANVPPLDWSSYLVLTTEAMTIDSIRFDALSTPGLVDIIDLEVYYDDAWNELYEGGYDSHVWDTHDIGVEVETTQVRMRFYHSGGVGDQAIVYEVELHRVIHPAATVTATGVSSGEHIVKTTMSPAVTFGGVNTEIDCGDDISLDLLEFTIITKISLSVLPSVAGNDYCIVDRYGVVGGFRMLIDNDDDDVYMKLRGTADTTLSGTGTSLTLDKPYEVAVSYDGVDMRSYYEGVLDLGPDDSGTPMPSEGVEDFFIGSDNGGLFFDGFIDEVWVYDIALSDANMLAHYNGTFTDTANLVSNWKLDENAGANVVDDAGTNDGVIANGAWEVGALNLYVDNVLEDMEEGASVPDTGNDWYINRNNVMPYINYLKWGGSLALHEYYNTDDDGFDAVYDNEWVAQTFTPTIALKVRTVKLQLYRVLLPGTITVSIKATDDTGQPTGGDLCVGTIDGDTCVILPGSAWYEITLGPGYNLAADTKYAIVVRALNGDVFNFLGWRADKTSPTYTGGWLLHSVDGGSNWTDYLGWDLMFEEWALSSVVWYQPISMIVGTNLDDREGTDIGETGAAEEDATITWGANPAGIDVTIGSLISSDQPTISPASEAAVLDIVPEGTVPAGGTVNTTDLQDNPLYPVVHVINEYTGYTEEQIWFMGATFIILIIMGIAAVKVPNHLLLAGTIGLVVSGFFTAMEIYQWWMMLVFSFIFVMSILMERKPVL